MAPRKSKPDPSAFAPWLASAQPGESLTYHIDGTRADDRLWSAAWEAHLTGKVMLYQKRINGKLHYVAQRISAKAKRLLKNWHRVERVLRGETPYAPKVEAA